MIDDPASALAALVAYGNSRPEPPVLFYQGDDDLLMVSRGRKALERCFRFILPEVEMVEALVDKRRFAALARRLELPVPETIEIERGKDLLESVAGWNRFPCILKPVMRSHWFSSPFVKQTLGNTSKAIRVDTRSRLEALLPLIAGHDTDFILQFLVEGGEDRVLSYHAYVRPGGEIVAEFTGRKIRTTPRTYGLSSYVEIRNDADVIRAGRSIVEKLGFSGVVKMDFKSDARDGRMYLFEVNPRFNLWHHPAALAGVNIPLLVYRDLLEPGSAPSGTAPRTGVRWMHAQNDLRAFGEHRAAHEIDGMTWFRQLLSADVVEDAELDDPLPLVFDLAQTAERQAKKLLARLPWGR